jgi:sugar/nucleoside kinase (ribokinase family)
MAEGKNVVLCYGVLAVDQIIQPEAFPQPDGHTRLFSNQEYLGGESTNVALTLA